MIINGKNIDLLDAISTTISWSLSPLISLLERREINKYSALVPKHNLVFIIGAPRTGSTLLYQILTNQFNILYVDNIIHIFNKNLLFGFKLSNRVFKNRPHNTFESDYGVTYKKNLRAPSEFGMFWYNYIPYRTHYVGSNEIPKQTIDRLKNQIFAVINKYQKPLLFKNLNTGQRLALIKDFAPNAKFIFIKREPIYTAQSIFLARRKNKIKPNAWWSVEPKNYKELLKLSEHEMIVKQIFYLERQITRDLLQFPSNNSVTINYSELCLHHENIVQKLGSFIEPNLDTRDGTKDVDIRKSEKQIISSNDFSLLKNEIAKLDWENYNDE